MKRNRFIALALVAAVTALGGAAARSGSSNAAGPPDTYVTSWDAVAAQAYTAGALTTPESLTILAYMEIAVYDSVVAIEGGYEPFAVDADVPDASPQAAVA